MNLPSQQIFAGSPFAQDLRWTQSAMYSWPLSQARVVSMFTSMFTWNSIQICIWSDAFNSERQKKMSGALQQNTSIKIHIFAHLKIVLLSENKGSCVQQMSESSRNINIGHDFKLKHKNLIVYQLCRICSRISFGFPTAKLFTQEILV